MTEPFPAHSTFIELAGLIQARRERVARLVNAEVVDLYWELGRRISGEFGVSLTAAHLLRCRNARQVEALLAR